MPLEFFKVKKKKKKEEAKIGSGTKCDKTVKKLSHYHV